MQEPKHRPKHPRQIPDLYQPAFTYCVDCECIYIDQFTVSDMDRFYASWKDGIRAKASTVKAFIKFHVKWEWLAKDITDDLQALKGSSGTVPKSPFADEELERRCVAFMHISLYVNVLPIIILHGFKIVEDHDAKCAFYTEEI